MVMKSVKPFEPPKPAPKPVAAPPKTAPASAKPAAPTAVRAAFKPDEMSSGRGGALRARASSQLGASSLATTLLTENADDAQVNCLDAANDYLESLPADRRAAAQVIFLDDTRPGAEGVDGHVLVRDGARFVDPLSGQSFPSLHAFDPQHHYAPAGTLGGQQLVDVLNTPPNSAARRTALDGVPASLSRMLVADGPWTPPITPANPNGEPFLKVTSRNGLNFRASPDADGRLLGSLVNGTEVRLLEPPDGKPLPDGWAYVEVNGQAGYVWAGADAVAGSDGKHRGMPYEDATELDVLRDGSPDSAVEWARAFLSEKADDFVDDKGHRIEAGYADNCLRFVMKAYGSYWGENPTRSPHLSNPGVSGQQLTDAGAALADRYSAAQDASSSQRYALKRDDDGNVLTGTAFGAFTSLNDAGAIVSVSSEAELKALDPRPPDGTIIFFAPTVANGGAGHIALLTWKGDDPYVLSSGTKGDTDVREVPLSDMIAWTGPLIGVANMDSPEVLNPATLPVHDPP